MIAPTSDLTRPSNLTHDHAELVPAVWRILACNFGEAIHLLRFEDPLYALDHSQWWVLVWVAHSWTCGDKTPSQADLGRRTGLSTRTVRRGLLRLEELDLLRVVRDKGLTTELDVGSRLAPLLRDFTFCRDPKIWSWTPRVGPGALRGATTTPDIGTYGFSVTPDIQTYGVTTTPDNEPYPVTSTADDGQPTTVTPDNGTDAPHATPANETYGSTHTPDNGTAGVTQTQDNESYPITPTADDERPTTVTPDNGTEGITHTQDNGPYPVGSIADDGLPTTVTPDNGTYVPRGTPDNGTYVPGRSRYSEPRSPALLGAVIPHNLKGFRADDSSRAVRAPLDGQDGRGAPPASAPPEAPPSLIKKKEEDLNSFSSSEGGPTPATQPHPNPGQPVDAATARRLALDALAIRFRRAHVGIPLPRTCDAADVKLVEACTANGTWDVETLRQTHLDAIEGAFDKAPPDRPPTPRYIWGQFRFFLAHASVGRAKRLRVEVAPKPKKARLPEDPPASSEWLEQHMREASARLAVLPDVSIRKRQMRFGDDLE